MAHIELSSDSIEALNNFARALDQTGPTMAAFLDEYWRRIEDDFLQGQATGKPVGLLSPADIQEAQP